MSRNLLPTISRQKSYQPVNWTARHRNCVGLELAGFKPKEIAEIVDWKIGKVSITLNDERADLERATMAGQISELVADAHVKMQLLSSEMVDMAADLARNAESENVQVKAIFGILDRGGYTALHRVQTIGNGDGMPDETLDRIEEVMGELKKHSKKYHTPDPQFDEEILEGEFEVVG